MKRKRIKLQENIDFDERSSISTCPDWSVSKRSKASLISSISSCFRPGRSYSRGLNAILVVRCTCWDSLNYDSFISSLSNGSGFSHCSPSSPTSAKTLKIEIPHRPLFFQQRSGTYSGRVGSFRRTIDGSSDNPRSNRDRKCKCRRFIRGLSLLCF